MEEFKTGDNNTKDKFDEIEMTEKIPEVLKSKTLGDAERATASAAAQRKAERKLVRRIESLVLPLLALSIMVGYLDRSNIGNARVLGIQKDLDLSDQQFLNAIMMFCTSSSLIHLHR
jgi:hypothetical protein